MNMSDVQLQLARLRRADELGFQISEKLKAWSENNLDSKIVIAKDGKSWHLELVLEREPPYEEWSMLFSDSIGQLRNTLDNLVFSVLTPLATTDELPNEKLIKFPIAATAAQWKHASRGIQHVAEPYYSRIKEIQPFSRPSTDTSGTLDGLLVLQRLSNGDKHNLQVIPTINPAEIQHEYTIEYATLEDARMSTPPDVDILKPEFKNGAHLVRQRSKGKIRSVEGKFHIESRVVIQIGELEVGITQILSELWNYVAEVMMYVADLPEAEFRAWAEEL